MFGGLYNWFMRLLGRAETMSEELKTAIQHADIATVDASLAGKNTATLVQTYEYAVKYSCMIFFTEDSQAFDFKNKTKLLSSPLYIKKLLTDQGHWKSSLNDITTYFTSYSTQMQEPGQSLFMAFCDAFMEERSCYGDSGLTFLMTHAHLEGGLVLASISQLEQVKIIGDASN